MFGIDRWLSSVFIMAFLSFAPFAFAHDECPTELPKALQSLSQLMVDSGELGKRPANGWDMTVAHCRRKEPPSEAEMLAWLEAWASNENPVDKLSRKVQFKKEKPKMIKLFETLMTRSIAGEESFDYSVESSCDKVVCVSKQIFGEKEGVQILYMLARYGFNGSPMSKQMPEDFTLWEADELDHVLMGLSDFPDGLLPMHENQPLIRYPRGRTLPHYEKFEKEKAEETKDKICVGANSVIQVFDCLESFGKHFYQQTIFHEVAHVVGEELGLHHSSEWNNFAQWEETTIPNGELGLSTNYKANNPKCIVSAYGATNPIEDFAESMVAYRYNPKALKEKCPEKYDYIKDRVFEGIEYLSEDHCKGKKIQI